MFYDSLWVRDVVLRKVTSSDVISLPWEELYQRASKGYRVKEWGSWVGAERIIALTFTMTFIPIVLEAFFDDFLDKTLSFFFFFFPLCHGDVFISCMAAQ